MLSAKIQSNYKKMSKCQSLTFAGFERLGAQLFRAIRTPGDAKEYLFGEYYALHDVTYDKRKFLEWEDENEIKGKLNC